MNITIRYIFSLSAIALLSILSYILMQVNISSQSNDSRVINIAGRQRMLSQKLSKSVLFLEKSESISDREKLIDEITRILSEWEKAQNGLKFGDVTLGVPGENSSKINELFSEIEPYFNTILSATQSLLAINENKYSENLLAFPDSLVKRIAKNEQKFLHGMERIAFQYDREAKEKVERHENIEDLFMFLILAVLLFEGFFIFRPAVRRMQITLRELNQTQNELRIEAKSLHTSEKALNEANFLLRSNIDQMPIAYIIFGLDFEIQEWNPASEKIFGFSREEAIGQDIFDLIVPKSIMDIVKDAVRPLFNGEPASYSESDNNIGKDGNIISCLWFNTPIKDVTGRVRAIQSMAMDITERKKAEEKLVKSRDQLRELSQKLESIREQERTEIARDIHDDLGQSLTALKLDISSIKNKTDDKDLLKKADSMLTLVDSTIRTVQKVAARLRPGILDDLGLISAMEWQLEEFQSRSGIKCKFECDNVDLELDGERSTTLFRIFQELLTNIARHANASKVKVHLGVKDDILTLNVSDDGIGISEEDKENSKSYGIMGIGERLIPWNGNFEITGNKEEGTKATVTLSLNKESNK